MLYFGKKIKASKIFLGEKDLQTETGLEQNPKVVDLHEQDKRLYKIVATLKTTKDIWPIFSPSEARLKNHDAKWS